jgi:hypothetical protein
MMKVIVFFIKRLLATTTNMAAIDIQMGVSG